MFQQIQTDGAEVNAYTGPIILDLLRVKFNMMGKRAGSADWSSKDPNSKYQVQGKGSRS